MDEADYVIGEDDVSAAGTATSVDAPVTEATVYQVGNIPTDELIAVRAAPGAPTSFLLFRNPAGEFPTLLCGFANPAHPPAEADCP
jgi:hypothetical protein